MFQLVVYNLDLNVLIVGNLRIDNRTHCPTFAQSDSLTDAACIAIKVGVHFAS
jgi:hypothetical protein